MVTFAFAIQWPSYNWLNTVHTEGTRGDRAFSDVQGAGKGYAGRRIIQWERSWVQSEIAQSWQIIIVANEEDIAVSRRHCVQLA